MGIDKAREREKHRGSHEERGMETLWGKGEAPWEKQMGTDKAREREKHPGSDEEGRMEILWGKGEAPGERQMGRGKERVRENGRNLSLGRAACSHLEDAPLLLVAEL